MAKIIVTLGPSTKRKDDLMAMKKLGVYYVRANMSHTSLPDLKDYISLAKEAGIPFLLDTEGPQVRTGRLITRTVPLRENDVVKLYKKDIIGNEKSFSLRPKGVIDTFHEGDQLYFDGALLLRILDVTKKKNGYVVAVVTHSGRVGENKGLAIDSIYGNGYAKLPTLSEKDIKAIKIGLREGVSIIAASFVRNGEDVRFVREKTKGKMKIISKIECQDALNNLEDILNESDGIIIDRHDLCKEIPKERIFHTQKKIFDSALKAEKEAFASSYMLESMVDNEKCTEHERYNVLATLRHGAAGLVLSAETTIGAHPLKTIETLVSIIKESKKITPEYIFSE